MQNAPIAYPLPPIIKKTTLYIGKIATTVSDATMEALLNACGPLVSWKPMKDTDTQAPKGFGFAEFQEADGVFRATQLLQGLDVDGQQLMVKPDTATQRYLDSYLHQHPDVAAQGNDEALAKVMEVLSSLAAARTADKAAAEFLADVAGPAPSATPESRKRTREEREAMERAYKNTLHDWERHERCAVMFIVGCMWVGSRTIVPQRAGCVCTMCGLWTDLRCRDRMKLVEADRERERRAEADRARTVRIDLQGSAADDEPRWRRPLYKDRYLVHCLLVDDMRIALVVVVHCIISAIDRACITAHHAVGTRPIDGGGGSERRRRTRPTGARRPRRQRPGSGKRRRPGRLQSDRRLGRLPRSKRGRRNLLRQLQRRLRWTRTTRYTRP